MLRVTILYSTFIVGLHVIGFFYPTTLLWGFHFLGFLPTYHLVFYLILFIVAVTYILNYDIEKPLLFFSNFMGSNPLIFILTCMVIFSVSAFLLHIRAPLLGDSFLILRDLQNTMQGAHLLSTFSEPIAMFYFYSLMKLLNAAGISEMLTGFMIGDVIAGLGFLVNIYFIARNLLENRMSRLFLFAYVVVTPTIQLFFGYVESYAPVAYTLSLLVLVMVLYLKEKVPFYIVPLTFALAAAVHFLSVLLVPAILYLGYLERKKNGPKNVLIALGLVIAITAILVSLPKFELTRFFPDPTRTHYLSLWQMNDMYQPYTLLSPYHFIDLVNLAILIVPFTVFMLAIVCIEDRLTLLTSSENKVFMLCALPIILTFLVLKFDLGMPKDWDIPATFAFALSVFAGFAFLQRERKHRTRIMGLITVVTLLNSIPYFLLNATADRSIKRFKTLIDSRIMSYESRFVATNHLAWYYYVSKDTSNLNPLLQDYIALNPGDWRAYPLLASSLIEFGDLKDARIDSLYECWIALEPDSNRAKNYYASHCINLAKRLVQEGRLDEAIARNKKAIRLNPKLAVAHNNLGVAYYAAKDYEEAIRCYQQAIELDSSYAQAYVNLGNVYDEIRDSDRAIALYQKALEIEPSNSLAYENMGSAYYRQGARLKAIESMQKAARLGALDAQHFLRAMGETW